LNVRDWLYVGDHCSAIRTVLKNGRIGETYNVGGNSERSNIEVVRTLCALLDALQPRTRGSYSDQITFVKDRPGHDRRYAIDASKVQRELGWVPAVSFSDGLERTIRWYLDHRAWTDHIRDGRYREWISVQYAA
jgi:dTDP-glucose 4,6-dehydratase